MPSASPEFPSQPDVVRWWARLRPARTAVVDWRRGVRLTYGELDLAAERWARALLDLGVRRGDRVAALSGSRAEVVALFGACLRIGAVLVPLNWRLAPPELARVLDDAGPRVLVGEPRFRALAEDAAGRAHAAVRWVCLDDEAPRLLAHGSSHVAHVRAEPDAPTMLLYTSGSTGRPKGAIVPHRQLFYNAVATTAAWELGARDVGAVSTPLFHTAGWHVFATPLLHVGGTVVLLDQLEPDDLLAAMAEAACTVAFAVPTAIAMLTASATWGRPLPALRYLVSGGAPCPDATAARVRAAGIAFRDAFGMTECGPNCFAIADDQALARPGSVGWPVPFLEARLDVRGRDAAVGEPGELLLRGPQLFGGYWNDPVATAEAVDADGWLHTGDLAWRDADGAHHICGRRRDMYISGGENVFPGEVEAALASCDDVAEAVVVGVPDARWGEVGHAFVVAREGRALTEERLLAHVRALVARYKVPRTVTILPTLPRLGSGKVDRRALAAMDVVGAS